MKIKSLVSLAVLFCSALISTAAVPRDDLDLSLVPPVVNMRPGPEYQDEARSGAMIIGMDRTPKGRIWACWTGTGDNAEAYFILATSDDDGATWSKPRVVIDPKDTPGKPSVKTFVGNLWTDPTGRLWLFFDQGLGMFDGRAGDWFITCDNPDAAEPVWSQPARFADGCTLNKPTVLKNGEWLLPVSLWHRQHINPPPFKDEYHDLDSQRMAQVYVSTDQGKTWTRRGGVVIPKTDFDEHTIVELRDGRLWMLARTLYGMAESFSSDAGRTWSEPQPSAIKNVSARFFIRRLASGRLLLVKNGPIDQRLPGRSHMSAFLSDDDGKSWSGGLLLDERNGVSYPDGFQSPDGLIHILYDRNRHTDAEILLAKFREEDVLAGKFISPDAKPQILANKATGKKPAAKPSLPPLTGEPAEVEVLDKHEADTFQTGVKLFLDRAYTLKEAPAWLMGKPFMRGSIDRISFRCTKAGVVTLLTPDPANPAAVSLAKTLEAQGFIRVAEPKPFQLFGTLDIDRGCVYQKRLERGEEYRLGKYALLVGLKKAVTVLYNGIQLPAVWPPRDGDVNSAEPMAVPYLQNPPEVIPINVGRQLFVDDFLIEQTDLTRAFHQARKHPVNPVLKPETPQELAPNTWAEAGQAACHLSHGGVFFDPRDGVFKMFYQAGWRGALALATSKDLLHWERPDLGIAGGNTLLPPGQHWSGGDNSVWLDLNAKRPDERLKFMVERRPDFINTLHTSAEGRIWSRGSVTTGKTDDYPSFFYNPFREVWVSSIKLGGPRGRCRYYSENRDFLAGADISREVYWCNADRLDAPDPAVGDAPQLYGMNAVAYESLLLGVFQIHLGPKNEVCAKGQFPKTIDLKVGFSRDGFHWDRPDRRAFIAATRHDGDWDRAYLHGPTGVCLVVGDELWFPYSGFSGLAPNGKRGDYVGGSIGMAVLRRDGFASMAAGEKTGTLTTRPLTFNGTQLFVNLDAPQGEMRVEILDEAGKVIAPFSKENCEPVRVDTTKQIVRWKNTGNLSAIAGKPVKFRFHLTSGKLYAFWVSPDDSGVSRGYVAAGGPEFSGYMDATASANKTSSASANAPQFAVDKIGHEALTAPGSKKKVHVLLFGGQSNALGWGYQQYLEDTGDPLRLPQSDVEMFYEFPGDGFLPEDTLLPLQSGNSNPNVKPLPNHYPALTNAPISRFGPELSFARTVRDRITAPDTKVAVIKFAMGGSSLWKPDCWLADGTANSAADGNLYRIFQTCAWRGIAAVKKKYPDYSVEVLGMGWVQGESDALDGKGAEYQQHLTDFIADVRATFGTNLTFVLSKISPNQVADTADTNRIVQWQMVRAAQDAVAAAMPKVAATETTGTNYTVSTGLAEGQFHYTTPALLQIGRDLGNALIAASGLESQPAPTANSASKKSSPKQ